MTHAFAGTVLLPGEESDGLAAVLSTDPDDIRLSAGAEELGAWSATDTKVEPLGKGVFSVNLAGEQILFTPETPAQFAEAMSVPLQPAPVEEKAEKKVSVRKSEKEDAKRQKAEAKVAKQRAKAAGVVAEKEVLGKGLTFAVVGVSAAVMGALVAISVTL